MIPGVNDTVRVNGRISIVDKEDLEKLNGEVSLYKLDERSHHLQGILIEVKESYGRCPRAFTFSHLWGQYIISANLAERPIADRDTNW